MSVARGYRLKEMPLLNCCHDVSVLVPYVQAKTNPWTELSDIEGVCAETAGSKYMLDLSRNVD